MTDICNIIGIVKFLRKNINNKLKLSKVKKKYIFQNCHVIANLENNIYLPLLKYTYLIVPDLLLNQVLKHRYKQHCFLIMYFTFVRFKW